MSFIHTILQEPSYGWTNTHGELIVPSNRQLFSEAGRRINILHSRKNWPGFMSFMLVACLVPFLFLFLTRYFSWQLLIVLLVYSLIIMGTHGTIWYHRYCTHKAYRFSHPIWRLITRHLVIKTLAEEIYAISHHVHHALSDKPGDPYNARAGFAYCMLSELNHQPIAKDLDEQQYQKAVALMQHTGLRLNSFRQYQKWGSIAHPAHILLHLVLNWICWYTILYFIGGHGLACTVFCAALLWFLLVRAFNYTGHAKGKEKHVDGLDFDRRNLSVNQTRPGLFTGEWHNNHHLFPASARAGFLPYQLDLAWIYIYVLYKLGAVSSYHDSKKEFLRKYKSRPLVT